MDPGPIDVVVIILAAAATFGGAIRPFRRRTSGDDPRERSPGPEPADEVATR
ncbi:MAG: hypothetical protein S0880_33145 [Actinomycetota bacterium]|nr:hypothetical protein [Actinomycetota bacterium]